MENGDRPKKVTLSGALWRWYLLYLSVTKLPARFPENISVTCVRFREETLDREVDGGGNFGGSSPSETILAITARKLVLWESLSVREDSCLKILQKIKSDWIVWWANPGKKDKVEQAFREHSRCIFTGKCKDRAETSWGKHVTRARGWRGRAPHD